MPKKLLQVVLWSAVAALGLLLLITAVSLTGLADQLVSWVLFPGTLLSVLVSDSPHSIRPAVTTSCYFIEFYILALVFLGVRAGWRSQQ